MKVEVNSESRTVSVSGDESFDAEELSRLIRQLIHARAQIHQDAAKPSGQVEAFPAPNWFTFLAEGKGPETILCMLVPGLGWVFSQLPASERERLVSLLAAQQVAATAAASDAAGAGKADQDQPIDPFSNPSTSGGGTIH